jgi:hypothetical protein
MTMTAAAPRRAAMLSLWGIVFYACGIPALATAQTHVHSDSSSGLPHNIPNFCSAATITSVGNGSWSSPSTWNAGHVPGASDIVNIAGGTTVTYDQVSDTAIPCIGVNGALAFRTDTNTRLKVGTLEVMPSGALSVGSTAQPVAQGVTAEIIIADMPLNTTTDPEQYGNGIIGFGVTTMAGQMKTPFVRLGGELNAGQTALTLSAAVSNWQPGDRVALPDSRDWMIESESYTPRWETDTIANVAGTTLNVSTALQFPHPGARDGDDVLKMLPHVANLSRNVIVRSENPNGTRGHIMFTSTANVDIRYSLFKDLGRTLVNPLDSTTFDTSGNVTHIGTNQIGRYAMHFHHLVGPTPTPASGYEFVFQGNVVDSSSKWACSIHNAHYGWFADNVLYNSVGTGLMTEDGNETANVIERNFILVTQGTGEEVVTGRGRSEFGYEGSGFWFHGPNNYVRDNVVASSNAFAITYATLNNSDQNLPLYPGADTTVAGQYTTVDLKAVPIREFARNEIYGSKNGITLWDTGAACCEAVRNVAPQTIKDTTLWHISRYGFYGYGMNNMTFDGWTHYGYKPALANGYEWFKSFHFEDYITRNLVIRNANIQDVRTGITIPAKTGDLSDIYGNTPGSVLIENSYFRAGSGITAETPWAVTGGGPMLPARNVIIRNCKFDQVNGNTGGLGQASIVMNFQTAHHNTNLVVKDQLQVVDYQGVSGQNFQVYYTQQAPSYVMPQSAGELLGAPVAGLTNQQAMATYGISIGGQMTPCPSTRPDIAGFVCTLSGTPPAAPRNLRITQ